MRTLTSMKVECFWCVTLYILVHFGKIFIFCESVLILLIFLVVKEDIGALKYKYKYICICIDIIILCYHCIIYILVCANIFVTHTLLYYSNVHTHVNIMYTLYITYVHIHVSYIHIYLYISYIHAYICHTNIYNGTLMYK